MSVPCLVLRLKSAQLERSVVIQRKVTIGNRIVLSNEGAFTNGYVVKLLCCWVHMDFNTIMFRRPTWLAHSSVILHTNCRQKFEIYTKTTWSRYMCYMWQELLGNRWKLQNLRWFLKVCSSDLSTQCSMAPRSWWSYEEEYCLWSLWHLHIIQGTVSILSCIKKICSQSLLTEWSPISIHFSNSRQGVWKPNCNLIELINLATWCQCFDEVFGIKTFSIVCQQQTWFL